MKSFILPHKLTSLKLFPWTPRLHFPWACQTFLKKSWISICRLKTKKMKIMFILQKKIIKTFPCRRKLRFWQPCWIVFAKSPNKIRLKCGSRKEIVLVFPKQKFLPKMFLRTRNISTILAKAFGQNRICFSAHRPKVMKSIKISLKRTSKHSPGYVEVSFDKPAGNFRGKCDCFCSKSGNCKN